MKHLLLLILFTPLITFSQNSFKGVIVDTQNTPIQFASISINQSANGTYSNEKGIFHFDSIQPTDTLKISCIGYESRKICVKDIKDQITLNSNSINVDEVVVNRKRKNRSFTIGYYNMGYLSPFPHNLGSSINIQLATFISYNSNPALIEKILLPITKANDTTQLKVYLYEVSKDGNPGKEIYSKTLLLKEIKNKIDISKEQIRMPSTGIFVAVEWLYAPFKPEDLNSIEVINSRYAFRLKMTKPMDTNYTYMYWKKEWRNWNNYSDEFRNVRFGLVLKPL
ncbi:carboxypeptidase-like regulatory domain-containing protein [bacterium]|nr:carboxypeptidase-like regulatory domain-containing protein [bacterium]